MSGALYLGGVMTGFHEKYIYGKFTKKRTEDTHAIVRGLTIFFIFTNFACYG